MKARLKFNKFGAMKFIGHLDLMRYFHKSFRRAGIDVAYSQGYSPHQLVSFAAPLGVGITSDGEYLDMQLNSTFTREETLHRINECMAYGVEVLEFRLLEEECKKSMSVVAAADYQISLKDSTQVIEGFAEKFQSFMEQEKIIILKKTKKSEKEIDIKPFIYEYSFTREDLSGQERGKTVADEYGNDNVVFLKLCTGSVDNLKPELVMEAFYQFLHKEYSPFMFQVHRMEVYANDVTKKEEEQGIRKLVSLDRFQTVQ